MLCDSLKNQLCLCISLTASLSSKLLCAFSPSGPSSDSLDFTLTCPYQIKQQMKMYAFSILTFIMRTIVSVTSVYFLQVIDSFLVLCTLFSAC